MKFINAITKRPGELPRHVNVSDSLRALQKNVGGYIEIVTLHDGLAVICNEEGRLKGLLPNCTIDGIDFYGNILIVGAAPPDIVDIPISWEEAKRRFPSLWDSSVDDEQNNIHAFVNRDLGGQHDGT